MAWSLAQAKQEMLRWVGTREQPPGSNNHPFSRWYGLQDKWCQMSVNYILVKGGLPAPGGGSKGLARTSDCAVWYNRRGKFSPRTFRPGCSVYFHFGDPSWGGRWLGIHHVGIGLAERPDEVMVWQGNSGDKVVVRWEKKRHIAGYGYNDWSGRDGPGSPDTDLAMGLFPGVLQQSPKPGPHVKRVQHRLNQIGMNRHGVLGGKPLKVDGEFGPLTRKVLVDFQRRRPWLTPDGKVDRDDWSALRFNIRPPAASYPGHPHQKVERGADVHVKLIQIRLNDIGNDRHGSLGGRALVVDGEFGELTRKVVVDFQRHRGLEGSGVVGPKTWALLWVRR